MLCSVVCAESRRTWLEGVGRRSKRKSLFFDFFLNKEPFASRAAKGFLVPKKSLKKKDLAFDSHLRSRHTPFALYLPSHHRGC